MSLEDHNYCGELGGNETPPKRRRRNDDDDGEAEISEKLHSHSERRQTVQPKVQSSECKNRLLSSKICRPTLRSMLRALFAHCMSTAWTSHNRNGITPDQLGATISSDLLNPSIWIPIRLAQSKSREGSLWGSPFTVTITTLDVAQLTAAATGAWQWEKDIKFSATYRKRKQAGKYHSKEMSRQTFSKYINRQNGRRLEDVFGLMSSANIRTDLREYDAVVYVFIFCATGTYRPKFQYGPDNFNIEIPLYHHNGHFDGIRCGEWDDRAERMTTTTVSTENAQHVAMDFMSQDCFSHHLSSNVCQQFNKCKQCGVVWNIRQNRRKGRSGHVCGEKFCYICKCYHKPERGCFIQQLKARRPKKYRLIAFDCETTQNTRIEGSGDRRLHSVNFISCHVACTKCIEENSWRNSLQVPCSICGRQRTVTFSHRAYERTQTDAQFITPCPMAAFAQWLLSEFDPRYPTMLFAHFGGRFDNIMAVSAVLPQRVLSTDDPSWQQIIRNENCEG
ncbi:hypothetical protein niasHT_008416 [Heterodera trifolii]|uniref:Uncharacterized protein n=1 Tax=Heterodera trifolii TaxID=157864 RepID=A0ABD2LRL7_9BILA